jgi:hypothetical protein
VDSYENRLTVTDNDLLELENNEETFPLSIDEGREILTYSYMEETAQLLSKTGNLTLNGTTGSIYAKDITLGTNAIIEEYLKLGNAKIYNPNNNAQSIFIDVNGKIVINDSGKMKIGNLNFDGEDSIISGEGFLIKPGKATFSNINCTGKITTMTFEKDKISTVGGALFFKPSYKIS